MSDEFRLMALAREIVDELNDLLDRSRPRLLYDAQLRDSAESISGNIREAYGRRAGPERNQFLRFARGSGEETDEHLRANYANRRLAPTRYWRFHNRLTVLRKMLDAVMGD